jgi:hypothetical protein
MKPIAFSLLILALVVGQSERSALDRLRSKISVEAVTSATPAQISGQYKNPSKELKEHIGYALNGDSLYVFSDKTYMYCVWGDVMPDTIVDKGQWTFSDGELHLKSDSEITWDPEIDRTLLAVRRAFHLREILLIGADRDVSYFENNAKGDPNLMLLILGKMREASFNPEQAAKVKRDLYRNDWRPDFFRK